MTRASRSRMPASLSPWARNAKLASWVRPERISFPTMRTQAVTILDAVSLLGLVSSISLDRGLHRRLHAPAQRRHPEDCRRPTACLPASYGGEISAVIARLPLSDYHGSCALFRIRRERQWHATGYDDGARALRGARRPDQDPRLGSLRGHAAGRNARRRDARLYHAPCPARDHHR